MRMLTKPRLVAAAFLAALTLGMIALEHAAGEPYPACDNNAAKTELARLYDNKRLQHAVAVTVSPDFNDDWKGRHCNAIVKWDNESHTAVAYNFYRVSGRNTRYVAMWIDFNRGINGPSY